MRLIKAAAQRNPAAGQEVYYTHRLREKGTGLSLNDLKIGGYYIYKETFGMVALVKVLQDISTPSWTGFRLKIKRILYSPWEVPVGTVFERGLSPETEWLPASWHFESCMLLIKSQKKTHRYEGIKLQAESVL